MKIFTLRQTKTQPTLLIYQKCPNFKWCVKICYKNKAQKPKLRFDSKESLRKQIKFLSWAIALKELYSFIFVRFSPNHNLAEKLQNLLKTLEIYGSSPKARNDEKPLSF